MDKDNLSDEIKSLNKRIDELENMLRAVIQPFQEIGKSTSNYIRLIGIMLEHGGLTPDTILSDLKDPIEKDIIRVLTQKKDLNISQITDNVRSQRGTASRRIIREKLKNLETKNMVYSQQKGSRIVYNLTDEVIEKWSQVLGFIK
ncbi:hypothetical protein B6U98_04880 [Thermoplasmatales archaeon ex4572_165]|nr:MAG: hypothetical protein B6U98_04880 [Thermoplasmatales archaeon ex4572_165]RLF58397.1 MAG: hypothetical protein DRN27_05535 [Thermoplasmata archaeon]